MLTFAGCLFVVALALRYGGELEGAKITAEVVAERNAAGPALLGPHGRELDTAMRGENPASVNVAPVFPAAPYQDCLKQQDGKPLRWQVVQIYHFVKHSRPLRRSFLIDCAYGEVIDYWRPM